MVRSFAIPLTGANQDLCLNRDNSFSKRNRCEKIRKVLILSFKKNILMIPARLDGTKALNKFQIRLVPILFTDLKKKIHNFNSFL